jgi:peptidoglycan/xylan/chitin deacetylase (PgdA/CDA1 family)
MLAPHATPQAIALGAGHLVRTAGKAADALLGSRGCLFTFHRVASSAAWDTLPNRDFYIDLTFLDQLLSYLARTGWHVVTIEEALERAARGRAGDRYVNFSVDDCYRDTFEEIIPLFRRHYVPVTLFVTTGIPDGTMPMWCAGLEDTLLARHRIILDGATVDVGTPQAKRDAYARIAAAWDGPDAGAHYARFSQENGIDAAAVHRKHAISWDMLDALRHDPMVEIGSHTVSHARISSLSPQDAFAELHDSRERLRQKLGVAARHFAFPYGRSGDCGQRDFDLARQAGYASAATTRKGVIRTGQDALSLPRNTLNGAHRNLTMIELHLTGVTGAAARVLGRV